MSQRRGREGGRKRKLSLVRVLRVNFELVMTAALFPLGGGGGGAQGSHGHPARGPGDPGVSERERERR